MIFICECCGATFTTRNRHTYHVSRKVCQRRRKIFDLWGKYLGNTEEASAKSIGLPKPTGLPKLPSLAGLSKSVGNPLNNGNWKCVRCESKFTRKWTLERHIRQKVCHIEADAAVSQDPNPKSLSLVEGSPKITLRAKQTPPPQKHKSLDIPPPELETLIQTVNSMQETLQTLIKKHRLETRD